MDQPQTYTVHLGEQEIVLQELSIYRAEAIRNMITGAENVVKDIEVHRAQLRRDYMASHYVELPRLEARRQFGREPLYRLVYKDDQLLERTPMLNDTGDAVYGPDPLGELTDDDWQSTGGVLRIPDMPSDAYLWGLTAMYAFDVANEYVFKLLAMAVMSNSAVADALDSGSLDARINEHVGSIRADATMRQVISALATVIAFAREQIEGPLDALKISASQQPSTDQPQPTEPESMQIVEEPAIPLPNQDAGIPAVTQMDQPTSSTGSQAAMDGTPSPSSTAQAGLSQSASSTG